MPINILVAEDNETDAALIRRAVAKLGSAYRLFVVENGEEAIQFLQGVDKFSDRSTFPFPEFVILDLKMPKMDGFDVLEWLQSHPEYRASPTLVLTASEIQTDIERAYRLGADTYFTKPDDFHDLVDLLKVFFSYWSKAKLPKGSLL